MTTRTLEPEDDSAELSSDVAGKYLARVRHGYRVEPSLGDLASESVDAAGTKTLGVATLGFATPGDGGGAAYRYAASEPSHGGKDQSADGAWWELAPNQRINVRMFGATGDGLTDDTAAFNLAIAFARAFQCKLHIPAGLYLIDPLDRLFTDAPTENEYLQIQGDGRGMTVLLASGDSATPLLRANPVYTGKLGRLHMRDLTVDGGGHAIDGLILSHLSACRFENLRFFNFDGTALEAEELWDSDFVDVKFHTCGNATDIVSIFKNRDTADDDSSCNNIGLYSYHVEESNGIGLLIRDSCRQFTIVRPKFHHNPGGYPPAGTDHIVIDAYNNAVPGNGILITGGNIGTGSGSGVRIKNTGGAAGEGYRGVTIFPAQILADGGAAVYVECCDSVSIYGFYRVSNNNYAPFRINEDAYNVSIDGGVSVSWDDTEGQWVRYDGADFATGSETSFGYRPCEIISGAITAVFTAMILDAEDKTGTTGDDLWIIRGGQQGQRLTLRSDNDGRALVINDFSGGSAPAGANIRLAGGTGTFALASRYDSITLECALISGARVWREISRSDNTA